MKNSQRGQYPHKQSSFQNQPTPSLQGVFNHLIPALQKAVVRAGYQLPTPIQEQSIDPILAGKDIIGTAQTGTGKTAAFTLPLLNHLQALPGNPPKGTPRALIMAPTRELAAQIGDSIRTYGRFLNLRHTTIFGGVNQTGQVQALRRGIDILVATPGRLLDLMQQGHIHLDQVTFFILDEVDRMLDMGFLPDIKRILAKIPSRRQTLFFSATMAPNIEKLARELVRDPVRITIAPEKPAVERIDQKVLFVGKKSKDALLVDVLNEAPVSKAIVFTQMKHVANRVVEKLDRAGIRGSAIHGNKSQAARTRALNGFKHGRFDVLVATDVAARGLDVDDISHVINYDLPVEAETYVHRIGRTARAGLSGDAISFCTAEEKANLQEIEHLLGQAIPVDTSHAYHSEEALQARATTVKNYGGNGGPRRGRNSSRQRSRR